MRLPWVIKHPVANLCDCRSVDTPAPRPGKGIEITLARRLESKRLAVAVAAVFVAVGLIFGKVLNDSLDAAQSAEARKEISEDVFEIASAIEQRFAFHRIAALALSSAVEINADLSQDEFSRLVAPFFENDPGILNLALEKGWIITNVHPIARNRSILGLDYRESERFYPQVKQVRETGEPLLAGPYDLIQGDPGLILRAPVIVASGDGPEVVGSVAVVSTITSLLGLAEALSTDSLVRLDITGGEGDATRAFFGAQITATDEPVTKIVEVGDVQITISVIPKGGWTHPTTISLLIYAGALCVTALILAILYAARDLVISRRRSWQQLSDAIEAIDDGFALYDADDRLQLCNSKYKSYYSLSPDLQEPGKTFAEIIWNGVLAGQYKDAIGREEDWFAERMEAHRNPQGTVEQHLDDGRWLKVSEARLDDGSTVGFRVDITSLKKAQHEAESASRAKTDFLNVMSHEIRTPLSAIIGYGTVLKNARAMPAFRSLSKLIEEKSTDPSAVKSKLDAFVDLFAGYATRIDFNGQHLLSIINDILYWNDIDNEDRPLNTRHVALDEVVKSSVEQLRGLAEEKGLKLTVSASDATVIGDRVRLQQVVLNLVGNAIKFTTRGRVTVSVAESDEHVAIEVTDTGCGISADKQEKIFETFYQVDSGLDRAYSGSGLGLAISRDIIEKHGGEITVQSAPGKGSTFSVRIPKHMAVEAAA